MSLLREFFGIFRSRGRTGSATLDDLNDSQLRDIGLLRDSEHTYRKLREPLTLEVLFPKAGGIPASEEHDFQSGPPRHRGTTKRRADAKAFSPPENNDRPARVPNL
jgi:hypothetical protein